MKLRNVLFSDKWSVLFLLCVTYSVGTGTVSALTFLYGIGNFGIFGGILTAVAAFVFYLIACYVWVRAERELNG